MPSDRFFRGNFNIIIPGNPFKKSEEI